MSTATIKRLAQTAPLEREAEWPPFAPPRPGTRLEFVGRWEEESDPGPFWRNVIRFAYWWSRGRVCLTPQSWQIIGVASSPERARAASLDESYFSLPLVVDHFLPREQVNLRGLRFWKRPLHRLFWHREPEAEGCYEVVETAKLEKLVGRLEKIST